MNADAVAALLHDVLGAECSGTHSLGYATCQRQAAALAAAPLPSEPRPVTERDRIEQAFIDGSVEGSHIDHDGALKEKP